MKQKLMMMVTVLVAIAFWCGGVAQAAERADGDAILIHNGWIGTTKTLIWRNVRFADLENFSCLMWGSGVNAGEKSGGGTVSMPNGGGSGFVMSSDGTTADVQFRRFSGGTLWCVKIRFTQEGADVYGQALWARYHQNQASINVDMETSYKGTATIATSPTTGGYGAYQVSARCRTRPMPPGPIVCPAAHQYIPYSAPVLLWKNAHLSDLSGLNAWLCGKSMSPRDSTPFVMSNNGDMARVQFRSRSDDGTIWCVLVKFFQNGDCIYGQAGYAKYAQKTSSIDYDFDKNGNFNGYPATGYNVATYGAYEVSATFNAAHSPFFTGVCGAWMTKEDRLIWRNVPLARVRNVRGVGGGKGSNFSPVCEQHRIFTPGTGDTPDTLALQMTYSDAGGNIRCLKVLLTQDGADVKGRILWAKYALAQPVSYDFDAGGNSAVVGQDIQDDHQGGGGYALSRLQADILPADGETTQQTDAAGNLSVLAAGADAAVTDLTLAGTLSVNGAGPFTLNGANDIGVLAVGGIGAVQQSSPSYWFLVSNKSHVNEFVVGGTGVNTIGQLAWRDVTQLEKKDPVGPQIGLSLSGDNTITAPFVPPSFTYFRIAAGRTSLPFLASSTAELGNGARFVVDEGATLALGGYDHQANYPIEFAVKGTLEVTGTLALDGASSITGTGTVTTKALASAGSATLSDVTFRAPAEGSSFSGTSKVTGGVTIGEGRTELAAGAGLIGDAVTVIGTLAVPKTATVSSLAAPNGTLEIGEETMLTVSNAVQTAGIGTLKVVSANPTYEAWRTPRAFMTGPDLTREMVKKFAYTSPKGLGWRVKIESDEETGLAVATLMCYPNQFMIIIR